MLSSKARAFSVDHLLGKPRVTENDKAEKPDEPKEEKCTFMGGEPVCRHRHSIEVTDPSSHSAVTVELCQSELWQAFHTLGTEMIITKTGRRMFPAVRVRVSGLKKGRKYRVCMDFVPVDRNKYRYVYHSSKWMVSGVGEEMKRGQLYQHPDSPVSGEYIGSQVISFEKIKLTNSDHPTTGQVSLQSMQKFQPRIIIQEVQSTDGQTDSVPEERDIRVSFPQTSFIAVTAYQNQEITRLKIARNPFAKGFREAGKCRSSLEAMMASFGVVINPSVSASPRKRPILSTNSNMPDHSSVKVAKSSFEQWGSPVAHVPVSDFRHAHPAVPYLPPSAVFTSPISYHKDSPKGHENVKLEAPPEREDADISDRMSEHTDTHLEQFPSSRRPADTFSSDIHPAFRWSMSGVQPQLIDQSLLSYYQGLMYNPITSLMYLRSPAAVWLNGLSACSPTGANTSPSRDSKHDNSEHSKQLTC